SNSGSRCETGTARTTRCRTTWVTASRSMARRSPGGRDTPGVSGIIRPCGGGPGALVMQFPAQPLDLARPGQVDDLYQGEPAAAVRAVGEPDPLRLGVHL